MNAATERTYDLLAERATAGLAAERLRELEGLLEVRPEIDGESFDLAAAAIDLAYTEVDEPLPLELGARVARQAAQYFGETPAAGTGSTRSSPPVPQSRETDEAGRASNVVTFPATASAPRRDRLRWSGWLVAAAASILAVLGWMPRTDIGAPRVVEAPELPRSASQVNLVAARFDLIARGPDVVEIPWTATDDPAAAGASGDVVWSTFEQHGFLRFHGLAVNDPVAWQYQLWIFDAEQDERYPIDGGVFDISTSGEQIVEVDVRLPVARPTLFAVTIEKPGGVVVSSRERLPLLAEVG